MEISALSVPGEWNLSEVELSPLLGLLGSGGQNKTQEAGSALG